MKKTTAEFVLFDQWGRIIHSRNSQCKPRYIRTAARQYLDQWRPNGATFVQIKMWDDDKTRVWLGFRT